MRQMGQAKNWLIILFLTAGAVVGGIVLWPESGPENDLKYCRVLFGRKVETEILVGADSDRLLIYLDGDLKSQPLEYRLREDELPEGTEIEIRGADGSVNTITGVYYFQAGEILPTDALMIHVDIAGDESFKQYCSVELSDSLEALNVAHFDGPLAVGSSNIDWRVSPDIQLAFGKKPSDINAIIGTFDERTGCWTVVKTHNSKGSEFPSGVRPCVVVEYQSKKGGESIVERYFLEQFC